MTTEIIKQPHPFFTDRQGNELENGYVYVGTAGSDPESSPITVYFDKDLTVPAPQPLRTVNGLIHRGGNPARVFVGGDYSIKTKDRNGVVVRTSLSDNNEFTINNSGIYFATLALMRASSSSGLVQGTPATLLGGSALGDQSSNLYYWDTTSTATDDGETVIKLTNTTTGRFLIANGYNQGGTGAVDTTQKEFNQRWVSVLDYCSKAQKADILASAGVVDVSDAIQAALDTGKNVSAPYGTYYLETTPVLTTSRQHLRIEGVVKLGSTAAALQIGDVASGNTVDFANVYINEIEGQDNTAGRDGIVYNYAVNCEVEVQRMNRVRYGHLFYESVSGVRYIHNNVRGNAIRLAQIGVYFKDADGAVTPQDNEGNDIYINQITGCEILAYLAEPTVQNNGSVIVCNFDATGQHYVNLSDFGQPNIIIATDRAEATTATGGTTDGSTAVVTGFADTSSLVAGCYVTASGGFPSTTAAYKVVSLTASTVTLDTNSDSVVAGSVTLTRKDFYSYKDMLLSDGLLQIGRRTGRNTFVDLDAANANTSGFRQFRDGALVSSIIHQASNDLTLAIGSSSTTAIKLLANQGVELHRRLFLRGQREDTFASGSNDDKDPSSTGLNWYITPNAAGSTLSGIAGGGDGRLLQIHNVGAAGDLTLTHEDAASGSGNRILLVGGTSLVIPPNGGCILSYDSLVSRWRCVGTNV